MEIQLTSQDRLLREQSQCQVHMHREREAEPRYLMCL